MRPGNRLRRRRRESRRRRSDDNDRRRVRKRHTHNGNALKLLATYNTGIARKRRCELLNVRCHDFIRVYAVRNLQYSGLKVDVARMRRWRGKLPDSGAGSLSPRAAR